MDGFISSLRRGDHLIWEPTPREHVYIVVTRVAKDTSWADLRMFTWAVSWTKRMPLPMPRNHIRFERWDASNLEQDAENACKGIGKRHGHAA